MPTITSNSSGNWATGGTWVGGSVPQDNDAVVIAAGHSVLMDADLSAYTGLQTVTIQGHATTPAMLYFKDGTSGYLKIRTGYNIVGTTGTLKGRLLANSDGVWGNTGSLAYAYKAIIDFGSTSKAVMQYLDVRLYCTEPTNRFVRTYGTKYDFTASGSTVDITNNTIDLGTTPPSEGTAVMITTVAGTLPGGLYENRIYYIRAISGNTCKLARLNYDANIVDITSTGSGACSVITGHTSTSTPTMNVLEDVTSDTPWTTTADHNRAGLVNHGPISYDQQRATLSAITASTITLSANVDSAQNPGARIYLASRNVSVRSACVSTSGLYLFDFANVPQSGIVLNCEVNFTAGSGTTFYGYVLASGGMGGTMNGVYVGATFITYGGDSISFGGIGLCCSSGLAYSKGITVTSNGILTGMTSAVTSCVGVTVKGQIIGCSNSVIGCSGMLLEGGTICLSYVAIYSIGDVVLDKDSVIHSCWNAMRAGVVVYGTVSGCNYTCTFMTQETFLKVIFMGGALIEDFSMNNYNQNYTSLNRLGVNQYVAFEDYGRVLGASRRYSYFGEIIKNNSVLRAGGASASLEVIPASNCNITYNPIPIFEWTELSVAAAAQNKSVYIRANEAFSSYPTAAQLYVEAEYISNGTTFATSKSTSTAVLSDGSTWVQFTIPEFTPAVAGHVRYRAYLGWYESGKKIYVDAELN